VGFLIAIPPATVNAKLVPYVPRPITVETELAQQLRHTRVMPVPYWTDHVAVCESSVDGQTARWDDGGRWAGGLGIYVGTWAAYGGYQYAPSPGKATVDQQIIIANRISVLGFQTKDKYMTVEQRLNHQPFFRPAVGFNGWGCIANHRRLQPKVWLANHWHRGKYRP
jgi:hypothetical protein